MVFNSIAFAFFFPLVTILYFILPHRFRWQWLLLASCLFYMAYVPGYILILLLLVVIDYAAGILIEGSRGRTRRRYLLLSLVSNLSILCTFKYLGPMTGMRLLLPLGLSFHTFQAMSYTIEVYRGHKRAERHLGIYALYVMFYPQLVSGPIERPQNLLPQLHGRHDFDAGRVAGGLKMMAWGFFEKVVIADRMGTLADRVYDHPADQHGLAFLLGTVFFSFQVYCDFAGYSDIAVGAAEVMGFRLMRNFDHPYFAKSIAEFWTRWHISLSSWFRDYLYIALGGNRGSRLRTYMNWMAVWLASGIWHGASWTFVCWGLLHGLYLICSSLTRKLRGRLCAAVGLPRHPALHAGLKMAITFCLICLGRVLFRARTISDAWYIGTHLFTGLYQVATHLPQLGTGADIAGLRGLFLAPYEPWLAALLIVLLLAVWVVQVHVGSIRQLLAAQPLYVRWPVYQACLVAVVLLAEYRSQIFIYFQF